MKHILLRLTGNICQNIRFYWFIEVFEEPACFSTVHFLVNSCSFTASFKDRQLIAVSLRLLPVLTHLLPALWRWHPTNIRPGEWRCHQVQNSHQGSPFISNSHFVNMKKLSVMSHLNVVFSGCTLKTFSINHTLMYSLKIWHFSMYIWLQVDRKKLQF